MGDTNVQDLVDLPSATADEVAKYLREQAARCQPFVRIGSRAMAVINIPQALTYDEKTSENYGSPVTGNGDISVAVAAAPHIYDLVTKVFMNMMGKHTDQSIVLCGSEISGKSLCTRMISRHICSLSLNASKKSRMISGVTKMETVLSMFGCAATSANTLVARFGRYTEYQFDDRGKMIGVKLLDYLFDRDRVVSVPSLESNFDIFYCLLSGATEQERIEWHLSDASSFSYLNRAGKLITGPTSSVLRERFDELRQHLKSLGIGARTQSLLFRTIVAILYLGEIEFENTAGPNEPCLVKNRDILDIVANMLGVGPDHLEYALTFQTKPVFKEMCTVFLSDQGAKQQRDEISKILYSLLFRWIIEHLNTRLCTEDSETCIGILDFVSFTKGKEDHNDFHTFMVNIANERLAAYSRRGYAHILVELYNEGLVNINPSMLNPAKTATAVELAWSPDSNSILSILNTESQKFAGDRSAAELKTAQKMHDMCSPNLLYTPMGRTEFKINHYVEPVVYDLSGFTECNRSMIGPDVIALFRGSSTLAIPASTNLFVRNLFIEANVATSRLARSDDVIASGYQSGIPKRCTSTYMRNHPKTATEAPQDETKDTHSHREAISRPALQSKGAFSGQDQQQRIPLCTMDLDVSLTELEETLDSTEIWTLFCISLNRTVGPIDWKYMSSQVKSMDIPRLIEIAKHSTSFAHSYTFNEFVDAYRPVIVQLVPSLNVSGYTNEMLCDAAVSHMAMCGNQGIRQGPNKIFLSDTAWGQFEDAKSTGTPISVNEIAGFPGMDRGTRRRMSAKTQGSGQDDDMLSEFTSVSRSRRPRSPAYTADQSNSDDVTFDLGPDPVQSERDGSDKRDRDEDSLDGLQHPKNRMSKQRCQWMCCTWMLTWWIPSFVLLYCCGMKRPDIRMAWREKVALCIIIFLMCCALLFFIIGFGRLLCPKQQVLSTFELASKSSISDPWVYANGRVYQISDILANHLNSYGIPNFQFSSFLGGDVSSLFFAGQNFVQYCPGLPPPQAGWDPISSRPKSDSTHYPHVAIDPKTGTQKLYLEFMNKYAKARLGFTPEFISKMASTERRLIIIHDNVYDVSGYFNADSRFLGPMVEQLFGNFYGKDATAQWSQIQQVDPNANLYMRCMNNMFYIGTVDHRNDFKCQFSNYMLLATSVILVSVVGFKFLAALRFGSSRDPEFHDKFVICQVPCYTEGAESLEKTLESLAIMQYDDRRKLLFVIADGMIVGSGNDRPTPQIVLDILGVDPNATIDTESFSFQSLGDGDMQHNKGKVYSGLYKVQGHSVPFVVVVKTGKSSERRRPGNRGKRDSQLILMRFLSRVHFNAEMAPLELEIFHHMKNIIGVHPSFYEYVLMVDADTEVYPDALNKLVSTMMHDSKIMGLCGETLLSNEKDSWITMIQVYEYFISHHLSKAFESMFGSVTCLPGCFSMYRIRTPTKAVPLLIAPGIVADYSQNSVDTLHLKNLLHLGEDRYLTTLMMKHFPNLKLSFNPDAQCRTNAPDQWKVLLSQRRRWINSTVHNLVELLSLEQMYWMDDSVYSCNTRLWFYIPLYSFWRFDDFSWGNTRVVVGDLAGSGKLTTKKFDPESIALRRWADSDYDKWEGQSQISGNLSSSGGTPGSAGIMKSSYGLTVTIPKASSTTGMQGNTSAPSYGATQVLETAKSPIQINSAGTSSSYATSIRGRSTGREALLQPVPAHLPPVVNNPTSQGARFPQQTTPRPTSPSDSDIIRELRGILATVDLMVVTKREVRDRVCQRLGVDLSSRRGEISALMDQILQGKI
ncbi:hypothetical protein BASA50_010488 [Batrachochytrium salamandrivorans]|uniref:chitin synthase n=1 Tax=Batrachochytrium salamandrivorans TaxID=1357716 RepID=A0ABQ8EYD6_9FUNG|nr:hypothetical protein BASA50_010488 [Batrachochytrium salamandrivorans]